MGTHAIIIIPETDVTNDEDMLLVSKLMKKILPKIEAKLGVSLEMDIVSDMRLFIRDTCDHEFVIKDKQNPRKVSCIKCPKEFALYGEASDYVANTNNLVGKNQL